jgi:hypothetical protein
MSLRDFFTDDRVNLISEYREKWRHVYLDTQPINRTKAAAAVEQAYRVMGKPEPEIIFCSSFRAALDRLQIYTSLYNPPASVTMSADEAQDYSNSFQGWADSAKLIYKTFRQGQKASSRTLLKLQLDLEGSQRTSLEKYIGTILPRNLTSQQIVEYSRRAEPRISLSEQEQEDLPNLSAMFERQIPWFPGKGLVSIFLLKKTVASGITTNISIMNESGFFNDTAEFYNSTSANDLIEFYNSMSAAEREFLSENTLIEPLELVRSCIWIDFAISVLNFPYNREQWWALKELTEQRCGQIIEMGKFCIVCDRPANNWSLD